LLRCIGIRGPVSGINTTTLVGNLDGGTTADPYGQTYQPQQRRPVTAPTRVTNYGGFYGHDTKDVMQELNVRDAQQQSFLANYG
jgi:hypothetical protein